MLFSREQKSALSAFFQRLKSHKHKNETGKRKEAKIEQILAYLEVVHAQLKKYSKKRNLICIESGAGNCYLSFLVYYFYKEIDRRPVEIHCLDTNGRLMEKGRQRARALQFDHMYFHACDIADFTMPDSVHLVYSLHACDSATDKALYLGLRQNATCILSVACCQHMIGRQLRAHPYSGITRHHVFKDRVVYMVGDALRALLLEMRGYRVDIFEFVSSRYTDKNVMLRARKGNTKDISKLREEYVLLRSAFHVIPSLEKYLDGRDNNRTR
jgi:hypothetical protein|tara:strand:+ start:1940 stop:2749 length:810 start_codon:yes stop_codon:yes gene_type:complete